MAHPARRAVLALLGVGGLVAMGCRESTSPDVLIGIPRGWISIGTAVRGYSRGIDRRTVHGGAGALAIVSTDSSRTQFSGVGQSLRADEYRGKRVRFRAWVRQESIVGTAAGIWMRIDGPGVMQGFDNFSTRPLLGSADWHRVEIILDVPEDAIGLIFGALMSASGSLLVDDITFDVVPSEGPTTNQLAEFIASTDSTTVANNYSRASVSPVNLDFEAR